MPRGQAASEAAAAAAATQNPASGGAPASGAPASGAPAGGGGAASGFQLPSELHGKSPEEIGQYYSDRYKDYDDVKSRAEKLSGYEGLNLQPDNIKNLQKWTSDLLAGLNSGKRAVLQNNQIVFVDDKTGQVAQPAANEDWLADWELADPRQQAERQAKHVWDGMLAPKVNELVQKYDGEIRNAVTQLDVKFNAFMDALEVWQANPDLKIRDVLARANEMSKSNPTDLIRSAADAMLSPKQQEATIKAEVAKQVAEYQAKWEAEHKAPALGASAGASHRFGLETPKNKNEARSRFLNRSSNGAAH